MKKGITLKDIARKLNMSVSTVSKSLKNDNAISTLTKERVKKLAEEWNYIPNESARHFKLNKSFTIGLILPDLLDPFFVLAINGVEEIAMEKDYNIILTQSHEDIKKEEKIVNVMISNRIDGVIVAVTKKTVDMSLFQKFKKMGIPVVCIARGVPDNNFVYVSANNVDGAAKATDYLIKRGHKRIAHLMGPETLHISQSRFQGYKNALKKNRIPLDLKLVKEVDFSNKETVLAMKELMKLPSPPTGIFTFKNLITLDAIEFLKTNHPHKLNQIEFTDFGNLPLFNYIHNKPVASIKEDFYKMGQEAAKLLFTMIEEESPDDDKAYKSMVIPCTLVVHKKNAYSKC